MPTINAGSRAIVTVQDGKAIWVTATGNARYTIGLPVLSASTSIPRNQETRIGYLGTTANVELICESGTLSYQDTSMTNYGSYRQSAQQNIPDNAVTKITGFVESLPCTQWDNANSRFVITSAGYYIVKGRVSYVQNATGVRQAAIYRNGVVVSTVGVTPNSAGIVTAEVTCTLQLLASDTIELYGFQNSGASLQTGVTGTGHFSELEIIRIA